ncbi:MULTISPECIES: hypothetical protein [unclassified Streptomyces]|uniref:hypothetical protein n=1 Tax=unclassified Streptomyces TaxID=2593676 RepID=UPI0024A7CEF1|nr:MULTISPECIES: hypothetical protein [unclassified Streptomyces]
MSRTQWWSLTALLAVVLGLLCGPTAFASAGPGTLAAAGVRVAQAQTLAAEADAPAPVAEATGERAPVPGCGKLRDQDGEPAVPSRARSAHDHAPGLAPWGLPAATGALPAEPPPGIRARAPVPSTPTPVELSVLRV